MPQLLAACVGAGVLSHGGYGVPGGRKASAMLGEEAADLVFRIPTKCQMLEEGEIPPCLAVSKSRSLTHWAAFWSPDQETVKRG